MERLERNHTILCTTRDYRELNGLINIRRSVVRRVGRHGGAPRDHKLRASIDRITELTPIIEEYSPDAVVSSCSPDAARMAYLLRIPHIGFSEAPHHNAALRLSVPLLHRLLIPAHIPKRRFSVFGIEQSRIVPYDALDAYMIVKNRPVQAKPPISKGHGERVILFRTYEEQAAYINKKVDVISMVTRIAKSMPDCRVVVLGRYEDEIAYLQRSLGDDITVIDRVVDSRIILEMTDVFIGSGGTMTVESALRGIPTISYNGVPNITEEYLVRQNLVKRAESVSAMVSATRELLECDKEGIQARARLYLSRMEDPGAVLEGVICSMDGDTA